MKRYNELFKESKHYVFLKMSARTKEYLLSLPIFERREEITKEYAKCMLDGKYFIETYVTVESGPSRIPFVLYPHQVEAFEAYETFQNSISMKTRQMGFTSFTSAYVVKEINFNPNYKVLLVSKTMNDAKAFLKTINDMIVEGIKNFPWLFSKFKEGYNNRESFTLQNESYVKAESTNSEAGRGIPGLRLIIVDECLNGSETIQIYDNYIKTPKKLEIKTFFDAQYLGDCISL